MVYFNWRMVEDCERKGWEWAVHTFDARYHSSVHTHEHLYTRMYTHASIVQWGRAQHIFETLQLSQSLWYLSIDLSKTVNLITAVELPTETKTTLFNRKTTCCSYLSESSQCYLYSLSFVDCGVFFYYLPCPKHQPVTMLRGQGPVWPNKIHVGSICSHYWSLQLSINRWEPAQPTLPLLSQRCRSKEVQLLFISSCLVRKAQMYLLNNKYKGS